MLEALAPSFSRYQLDSLEGLGVGVAWCELAAALVRERVEAAAKLFPRRRVVAFPFPEEIGAVFMREVAESHSSLFPEHAGAYGQNVRTKLERCLRVTDGEFEASLRHREHYRDQTAEALDGLDLLITPTLGFVAPAAGSDELDIGDEMIRFTSPSTRLAGQPSRCRAAPPSEDCPPRSS